MAESKIINVGIDIRDLRVAKTGQKTILDELCKQFRQSNDPEIRFIFFDTKIPSISRSNKLGIILNHVVYQWWKQVVLPWKAWRNHCDILFCSDYFVPYIHLNFKTVEYFYDAFFFEYPEHYNRLWLQLFHRVAMPAARKCSRIITITQYARQVIHQRSGLPLEKITAIYPSRKTLPENNRTDNLPEHLSFLQHRKYLLHVGVFEKRKNIPTLLQAFRKVIDNGHANWLLVLAGEGNNKKDSDDTEVIRQTISDLHLENHVICTGYLSDAEVAFVYQHASLYVFPSFNEGFGIPILEAFSFDLPVIVANNTCLPEVGGDAVIAFDPYSSNELSEKICLVLGNEDLRKQMIAKGKERLELYSWEKASAELINVFKQLGRNGE